MKPDAKVLYSIYEAWKAAVDKIADVQGLYPTFVTNVISPTSVRVAKTNGVGNVWGLEEEPLISKSFQSCFGFASNGLTIFVQFGNSVLVGN